MWGADIPHTEGTAPYTIEALRIMLWDMPETDLDALLATRAASIYKLDLDRLQATADRIGPTVEQLKTSLPVEARPRYPEQTCCTVFRQ
jgi:hypothetical protein